LQEVTRVARAMVTQLGMSDELGPEYFGGSGDNALEGRAYVPWEPKEYSDETARRIDQAVQRLITEAHDRAHQILSAHRPVLDALAAALLQEESIDLAQLTALVKEHEGGSDTKATVGAATSSPSADGVTTSSDGA
jgi:cell division protease FtsH